MNCGRHAIDMTGQVIGRLTVLSRAPLAHGDAMWNCVCVCGTAKVVAGAALRRHATVSCGCLRMECITNLNRTHGMANKTPEYRAWCNAKSRCFNEHVWNWSAYGGRGITMAAEFVNSFEAFYTEVGPKPEPHAAYSLDRFPDPNGDYTHGNLRWATRSEQATNQRTRRPYHRTPLSPASIQQMRETKRRRHAFGLFTLEDGSGVLLSEHAN